MTWQSTKYGCCHDPHPWLTPGAFPISYHSRGLDPAVRCGILPCNASIVWFVGAVQMEQNDNCSKVDTCLGSSGSGPAPLKCLQRSRCQTWPITDLANTKKSTCPKPLFALLDNERNVAQFGSAPALGAGGRWFESSRSDQ